MGRGPRLRAAARRVGAGAEPATSERDVERTLERIAAWLGRDVDEVVRRALLGIGAETPREDRALAALMAASWRERPASRVGLGGGQGAGKSTLAHAIRAACDAVGLRVAVLSLDDYYVTRAERGRLARTVHPLFETRGPPGTHDIARCREAMAALLGPRRVDVPVFNKGLDDRVGTHRLEGPFDVVLLEGWCVGAPCAGDEDLDRPINRLEREEDADGIWRRAVERALDRDYQPAWDELEALVFLRVPGLDAVRRWRLEQESARPASQRLDATAVARFVAHFERITLRMLERLPGKADLTIALAPDHSIAGCTVV